jgi:hypothetical protein
VDELAGFLLALAPWERMPTLRAALAAAAAEDEKRRLANELCGRPFDHPFRREGRDRAMIQDEDAKAARDDVQRVLARLDWNLLSRGEP